ncbi:WGxxGxxG-CTERM domain-containing protein [Oculatella sp. FACHB-28]|uniref:WGxxGxxG family protein n=1 Tax=Cyanophyceae TaxID=3028117 RepID=UPI001688A3C8|nr:MULTISPECIES: WGxxGxxG family protein [Cyanophyceae]MBD1870810.1 WGxxGxxG-CTERM domain-containing protein [Cyanobacteria bacterium FACHB-471]MBD1998319.1 WGxxGxxG-CTERM domain-containing protein [Leptolyngbya sp. FACHB-541]MBD2056512.1 WGxxGxxG-CTERM domain-containing protein [Oculatella sp. FACHB-28]MBD2069085.1 WGxxGxxG-CTERM domain-containing protein [Leptolyngbya sp. FACHB-671]
MKLSNFAKLAGASALGLSLTVLSVGAPSFAQDAPAVDGTTTTTETEVEGTETEVEGDRDFDWGWLGLLGLIGLAGLARKDDDHTTRYREPDEVSRTSSTRY